MRGAAALAARRDGIDYDALPESLATDAVEPGDSRYSRVRTTYLRGGAPGIVLRPRTVEEVVEAVGSRARTPTCRSACAAAATASAAVRPTTAAS